MSDKYYRVKKDTFLWKEGAILKNNYDNGKGYKAIQDIWNSTEALGEEYISHRIIEAEDNKEWFENVYPDSLKGSIYRTKDQMVEFYKGAFS